MRLFCKFYPDIDTVVVDLPTSATLADLRTELEKLTNLKGGDVIKVIANNTVLSADDANMWTMGIKPDTTFHIVVEQMAEGPLKVNTPKELGPLGVVDDDIMARIFSFLDASAIVATSAVARKWRVINHQKQTTIWSHLVSQLYQSHHTDDVKEPHDKFTLKAKIQYKRAFMERQREQKDWEHVRNLSQCVPVPSELPKFEKEKDVRIKRKPKALTEDEEKFLVENDIRALKKQLRTHKDAKEKVKQYQSIEKKKEEAETGAWKSVPEQYSPSFPYEQLMIHSFGFKDEEHTGFYDGRLRFYIVNNADGKPVYIGELEGDKENFKFGRIIVDDANTDTQMDVTRKFYELWEKFKTNGVEEKNMIKLRVEAEGVKNITDLDAVADILVIAKKYSADAKVERPDIAVKRADKPATPSLGTPNSGLLSPRTTRLPTPNTPVADLDTPQPVKFEGQVVTYKEDEGQEISLKNISEAYTANLVAALKAEVGNLALPALETAYLAKIGKNAEELGEDNFEGKCFAQGVTAYLKETEKVRAKQKQQEQKKDDENDESAFGTEGAEKRSFQKAYLVVKSEEELQRVTQGIRKQFA